MATPTAIVAYLALFAGGAGVFLLVNLLIGRLVRPKLPNTEKLEVYECGEPTIGSSFVQFDLRFYVVALLFIIFDVEVAFFFPWATVFGKAAQLASPSMPVLKAELDPGGSPDELSPYATERYRELGIAVPTIPQLSEQRARQIGAGPSAEQRNKAAIQDNAQRIALMSLADIGVFFAVLMVGFAYVWRRGDLDWVRAVVSQRRELASRPPPPEEVVPRHTRPAGSILSA